MSFLPLDIDPQALKAMTDDAEAAFPNECCGFSMAMKTATFER